MREIVSPLDGIRSPFGPLVDPYKIVGKRPPFVADFDADRYRANGGGTSFTGAITHSRSGNATMVVPRKWSLGNLLTYSEQFDNAAWVVDTGVAISSNTATAPNGSQTADIVTLTGTINDFVQQSISNLSTSSEYTMSVWMRVSSGSQSISMGNLDAGVYEAKTVTTDWQLFSVTQTPSATTRFPRFVYDTTSTASVIEVWGAHLYRSDRGGMQLASDGTTYAPTTDTAIEQVRVDDASGVGEVVWAPHNLLTYSEDVSSGSATSCTTPDATTIVEGSGSISPSLERSADTVSAGQEITLFADISKDSTQTHVALNIGASRLWAHYDLSGVSVDATGSSAEFSGEAASITDEGEYYRLKLTATRVSGTVSYVRVAPSDGTDIAYDPTYTGDGTSTIVVLRTWLHRSDLGGMTDNPATGNSYVPTTSAAVYLPRVGHHVYDPENGAVVGPELAPSLSGAVKVGDAATTVTYNADGTVDVDAATTLDGFLLDAPNIVVGRAYQVSVNITLGTSTNARVTVAPSYTELDELSESGTVTLNFVAESTFLRIDSYLSTGTFTVNSISVREVNPWVNEGILHESEQRVNLFADNTPQSSTAWNETSNITYGTQITQSGVLLEEVINNSTGTFEAIWSAAGATVADDGYVTASAFIKAGPDNTRTAIRFDDTGILGASTIRSTVLITFTDGVPSAGAPAQSGLTMVACDFESFGDGLYRVRFTVQNTSGAADDLFFGYYATWSDAPASAGEDRFYFGGAQLELASTPSSYIPTSGSTVTRAADTLTVPSANLPWPEPVVIGTLIDDDFASYADQAAAESAGYVFTGCTLDAANDQIDFSVAAQNFRIDGVETFVEGKVYQVSFTTSGGTVGEVYFQDNFSDFQYTSTSTNGTFTFVFVKGSGTNVRFGSSNFDGSIDNISVREINPLAVSIQMDGRVTYADEDSFNTSVMVSWQLSASNEIRLAIDTNASSTGEFNLLTVETNSPVTKALVTPDILPGVLTPFNAAGRIGSNFVQVASAGAAGAANITPTALPDLSATDLRLGYDYMGTLKTLRIWGQDLGDTGIEEAST